MKRSKYLILTLASIIAFCSGCAIKGTARKGSSTIYPAASIEAGIDYIDYDIKLGKKIQTTPVHDDDGGSSMGEATAKVNGTSVGAPRLGLEASLGTDKVRGLVGLDLRYRGLSDTNDNGVDAGGLYESTSQPLPSPYDSRAFTLFRLEPFTCMPKAGLELALTENVTLGVEYGFPYLESEVVSGHYRFDAREIVQRASHSGFGRSIGGSIGYDFRDKNCDSNYSLRLVLKKEEYRPTFAGERAEIDALVLFIGLEKKF